MALAKKIYYTAVARGNAILAEYTEIKGTDWRTFTQETLKKVKVGKYVMQLDQCDFFFEREPGNVDLIYLVAVEKGFSQQVGMNMLSDIQSKFSRHKDPEVIRVAKPFSMNPEFQSDLQHLYVDSRIPHSDLTLTIMWTRWILQKPRLIKLSKSR